MKILGNIVRNHIRWPGSRQGMALGLVMVIVLAVSILGIGMMSASSMNAVETSKYLHSVKAFWLAEAGVQRFKGRASAVLPDFTGFTTNMGARGTIQVTVYSSISNRTESVGTVQGVEQKIQVNFWVLPAIYEKAIYGANVSGLPWTFTLRGIGNPNASDVGGRDIVMGDVFANGDVKLYEQSVISNAPAPNTYSLLGDVRATGTITTSNSASIAGGRYQYAPTNNLPSMVINQAGYTFIDIAQVFSNNVVDASGRLPVGNSLRNVVVRNPPDRSAQNNSTPGVDDFYFEPQSSFYDNTGGSKGASTPLDLGAKTIYYVDGHVWINNLSVYGFKVSGTATIAATRDIHISDNLKYATANDLLALIALGTYNSSGQLVSGGNVYFGDPTYGTLYTADAFMLAANNFYYNTVANNPSLQIEPETGFQVYGNFAAMNQVNVYRDWYQYSITNGSGQNRVITWFTNAAWFNPSSNRWQDVVNGNLLLLSQTNTLRHYQMIVKYDERIRNQSTQPPGLPGLQSGTNGIYQKISDWKLYPY